MNVPMLPASALGPAEHVDPDRVRSIMERVRKIELKTRGLVSTMLAGSYQAAFRGRGMDFDRVREYVPGDEVRTIDWNVTARTGHPFVKQFREERELELMLLVDVSASQEFGSGRRSKLEAAVELSALLALSAVENGDKVGLLAFHRGADLYMPPRKGGKHALRVVREVLARGETPASRAATTKKWLTGVPATVRRWFSRLQVATAPQPDSRRSTSIAAALEFCRQVLPRKSVMFLVSDFLDEGYLQVLRHANRKHDVVAALITDPREATMPPAGLVTLEDAESGQLRLVDTRSQTFRTDLAARAAGRQEALRDSLRASGIDLVVFDAAGSMVDPLLRFFHERERRGARR